MLVETKKQHFLRWTDQLIRLGFRNEQNKDFEWKGKKLPSIFNLLKSFQQRLRLSEDILICGLCLMKRVISKSLKVDENSIYKLAIVCLLIAQKFYSDFQYDQQEFSICSGVTVKDIAFLEKMTIEFLDFNIVLTLDEFNEVKKLGED